jgi:hypothetical protein
VVKVSEVYSSQKCHGRGEVRKTNRVHRGLYWCDCRWRTHADVNGAAKPVPSGIQGYLQSRSDGVVGIWRPPWSCQYPTGLA